MGLFGFYSWLVKKYPKVVVNAIQETTTDAISPNPNGFEFDNLYLDLNGIIHPCFHPDEFDDFHPTSFEEVFNSVFEYVDRLFNIVRPRKLLYLAIDGVAPTAKLSRIRAGRYSCAFHMKILEEEEEKLRIKYARKGRKLLPKSSTEVDDPNIISPGTVFMYELSKALQGYIQSRLKQNPAWKDLKVILSDANVPGEGEHKIVQFMRSQRVLPGYDVNTRHCIHGLDADLIMLALATHELHISILRETRSVQDRDVDSPKPGSCKSFPIRKYSSYEFAQIWILKEYLELEMQASDAPEGFKFDLERVVDDFILICFFVGNDFLPRLPSLDVREGALDLLLTVYKREFKSLGGYIVDSERIHEPNGAYLSLERLEKFVHFLGTYEDQILQKRTSLSHSKMRRVTDRELASRNCGARDMETPTDITNSDNDDIIKNTMQLKEEVRKRLQDVEETVLSPSADEIKYGSEGWKDRYYDEFFADEDQLELDSIKQEVVEEYTEGLCWVLLYYLSGVPSWTWHYPYYYGPCASDFKGIGQLQVEFQEGVPFEPFSMLMAILPPRSFGLLPRSYKKFKFWSRMRKEYAELMNDEIDDLIPFYSLARAKEELTEYEVQQNSLHTDVLFIRALSDFGSLLVSKKPEESSGFVNLVVQALDSSSEEDVILCVHFDLPKLNLQALRILDNVNYYPPKTVYEADIKETILWHEHDGPFQDNRAQNQKRSSATKGNEASGSSGLSSRQGLYNHPNMFRPQRPTMASPPRAQAGRGRGQYGYSRGSGSYQRW